MDFLFLLIGLNELVQLARGQRAGQAVKAACLGAGLALAGLRGVFEAPIRDGLEWTALPLMALAIALSVRDGSFQRTFFCWTRKADGPGPAERSVA